MMPMYKENEMYLIIRATGPGNPDRTVPAVYFHLPTEPFGFLSNWYGSDFTVDGTRFSSCEQYIMYRKCMLFGDTATARRVMGTDSPEEQQKLARNASGFCETVWSGMRQMIAVRGLYAKFSQDPELKRQLLETGNAYLVECAGKDRIWACGRHLWDDERRDTALWTGGNLLGFTLMEVRDRLRDA